MDNPTPPIAKKVPHTLIEHGHERIDEYHWMRLTEEQRELNSDAHTKEVVDHLKAENAYTEAVLKPVEKLKQALFEEMKGRIKQDDSSAPYRENGYWYRHRYEVGREYPIHERRKDIEGNEMEILLDENVLAEGLDYFDLGDLEISPDNSLIAYSVDTVSRRKYTVKFRNIESGEDLEDKIENTSGGVAWADNKTVFYTRKDETLRSYKIFRHILGTDVADDAEVFHEKDEGFNCYVYRSRTDKYVIIGTYSTLSNEYHLLSVDDPLGEFRPFMLREKKHEYTLDHVPGKFYILTNWNALNFRLMECPEDATSKEHWKEVIPHRSDVRIEDVIPFNDHLAISERHSGLTHLRILRLSDGKEHDIAFNDPAYVCYPGTNPELDSSVFRYGYNSMTTPPSVFLHDLNAQSDELLKQHPVLGGFNSADYRSQRLMIPARDGTLIPYSLLPITRTRR